MKYFYHIVNRGFCNLDLDGLVDTYHPGDLVCYTEAGSALVEVLDAETVEAIINTGIEDEDE